MRYYARHIDCISAIETQSFTLISTIHLSMIRRPIIWSPVLNQAAWVCKYWKYKIPNVKYCQTYSEFWRLTLEDCISNLILLTQVTLLLRTLFNRDDFSTKTDLSLLYNKTNILDREQYTIELKPAVKVLFTTAVADTISLAADGVRKGPTHSSGSQLRKSLHQYKNCPLLHDSITYTIIPLT